MNERAGPVLLVVTVAVAAGLSVWALRLARLQRALLAQQAGAPPPPPRTSGAPRLPAPAPGAFIAA